MGLNAFVHCRCWQDGIAPAPPVPATFDPDEGIVPQDLSQPLELDLAFYEWRAHACLHEEMAIASEWVGNWTMVRSFQDVLDRLGAERFPTMVSAMPTGNSSTVDPQRAARFLEELERFAGVPDRWPVVRLVDEETSAVVGVRVDRYDGVFIWSGREGQEAGLSADGSFFVMDLTGQTLFRSSRFTQRVVEPADPPDVARSVLVGADGQSVIVSAITTDGPGDERVVPERLRVVVTDVGVERHRHIAGALAAVMRAAVETGNPVIWT